uniref:Jacalin-type lectin domain-containing protein n=1 Tax=Ananas comosus var. bracteatus TaxID=296719 RepID=A0A6V7QF05_ANACO|nr:unnamed protein product [Ananas comosus var. bracteatus]
MSFKDGKEKNLVEVGPWGGLGGSPWDDGVYTTVRQVVVVHGAAIDSIQIEYDRNGSSVWSGKHGGNGGSRIHKVMLEYPYEFITSVSGYYGPLLSGSPVVIRSLTIASNLTKYGPFGSELGTHFSLPVSGGKVVGFHGRSGWYLDSIGVHLKKLWSPNQSMDLAPSQSMRLSDCSSFSSVERATKGGYDIVLAVREKGDTFKILTGSYPSEALPSQRFKEMNLQSRLCCRGRFIIYGRARRIRTVGGRGGVMFDDGVYTGVRQVNLTRNVGITSMKVLYDRNGQAVWGNKHGTSGGISPDKIVFDFPMEILTYITGYFGTMMYMGPAVIKSLTFHTTKRVYGPYGDEQGTFFSSCLTEGKIVGFHGRKGWFIDSIGVHVLEGKVSYQQDHASDPNGVSDMAVRGVNSSFRSNKLVPTLRNNGEEVTYGVVKEPVPVGPGPWGGDGGKPWDDGVYSGIKQVYILRGEFINSIQIEYDRSGQSVWSMRHGGSGETYHRIKFEYPHEILNCISGYYNNQDDGPKVLKSLTFFSNRGKYGPFGEETGIYFTSATTEGKVVGFHGRSGSYLDAIGVHMQHWLGEKKTTTKSIFSKYFF